MFDRYRPIVPDWLAFEAAMQTPLPLCIWANPLRTNSALLRNTLAQLGAVATPLAWTPHALRLPPGTPVATSLPYLLGHLHIQEEVSQLPVHLLPLQPSDRVLDLCAAPGNKTLQAATHVFPAGYVVANDLHFSRLTILQTNLHRLGLPNILLTQHDARTLPIPEALFDAVLADVPCSCEGTLRKNPHLPETLAPARAALQQRQVAILQQALACCKPRGHVVYATCTFAPEENEAVVDAVLKQAEGTCQLCPIDLPHFAFSPGLTAWQGQTFDTTLRHAARIWPHQNDTGGFFIALLQRLA